jgi:hypothetical protein
LTALDERQHAVLVDEFLVDGSNTVDVEVDGVKVHQRHAEFM